MTEGTIRVLLVEDDPADARRLVGALAAEPGLSVDREPSVGEALARARRVAPDVVLLDLDVPDAPGLQGLARVRSALPNVPVVMLSDRADDPLGLEAVRLGAQDCAEKRGAEGGALARAVRFALARDARRLRAEEALRESEERYRRIVETAGEGIWVLDREGRTVLVNLRMAEMLGCASEELARASWTDFMDDANRAAATRLRLGGSEPYDLELRRKDGTRVAVVCSSRPILDRAGAFAGALTMFTDITERKRAEEALARSEEVFSRIFRGAAIGIGISSLREGRVIDVNERLLGDLGYRREELIGRSVVDLGIYVDPGERERLVRRVLADGAVRDHETRLRRKSGEPRDVVLSLELLPLERQREPLLLVMVTDVTEPKRAAEALRRYHERVAQSQRIEAIGRLAGGVAHDFNNLLTVIAGHSSTLLRKLAEDDGRRAHVEEIRWAGERAAALTRQLLAFSRNQVLAPRILDLNQLVRGMERILRRLAGERVVFETRLDPGIGAVRADPSQLEQVLLNLALNARDAMPQGGLLSVETANTEVDEATAASRPEARPGAYVALVVRDTGVGMTPEVLARAFEPFFTTKEPGKGTGLGLSIVHGIVNQSDGFVTLESAPGRGTTARAFLPRVPSRAEAPPVLRAVPRAGSETVLVVEDERPVRDLVRDQLRAGGYEVLDAKDPDEALAIGEARSRPIDLLVADVGLPGMGGDELVRRFRPFHPRCRVLYISGYPDEDVERACRPARGRAFLRKPFTEDVLLRKVREVLDAGGRR